MLIGKIKDLVERALVYNLVEAAMRYHYDAPDKVILNELADDIRRNAIFYDDNRIIPLLQSENPDEILNLPKKVAEVVKSCYREFDTDKAEEIILEAVDTIKGKEILNILS